MRVRFRWEKFFLWMVLAGAAGLGVGQLAAWVGGYLRPVVVFPLAIGGLLGGMLMVLIRLLDLAHRGSILVGLLWASVVCAASEHWGCYLGVQRDYERTLADWQAKTQGLAALSPQLAQALQQQVPESPGSFGQYFSRQLAEGRPIGPWLLQGHWVWASWLLEAGLVGVAAGVLVWSILRWPYCPCCESWYRTIRQSRLAPADLDRWADLFQIPNLRFERQRRFRGYVRLFQCLGQCTPGRVELVWENPPGQLQTWQAELSTQQREKLDSFWQASDAAESAAPNGDLSSSPPADEF